MKGIDEKMTKEVAKEIRVTKRMRFEQLLAIPAIAENEDLTAFVTHEIELLNRKNTSSTGEKKLTATQKANEEIKEKILAVLTSATDPMTIGDIQKAEPELAEMSNQKLSALVRQLKESEKIVRTENKRKAYFSIA